MSRYERTVRWVTDRFEGVDAAYRHDVALTTGEVCRGAGWRRRCSELLGLVALALRLRSHAGTAGRPEAVWGQGIRAGAVLLLTALATQAAAAGGVLHVAVAVALVAAAVSGLRGQRAGGICLVVAATVTEWVSASHGVAAAAFASGCMVAVGGLLAGPAAPVRRADRVALTAGAITFACAVAALVLGSAVALEGVTVVFAWVVPIAMVGLGWFDPRLAAAATMLVFARLTASGFGELGRALTALEVGGQRVLLARWVLMGTAVLVAWLVTDRSIRRLVRV